MVGVEDIFTSGEAVGSGITSTSDAVRSGATYPGAGPLPVDVPPAEPWGAWFHQQFSKVGASIAAGARSVGAAGGGFFRELLSPLYPLLLMLAVLGVIGFLILGRVRS